MKAGPKWRDEKISTFYGVYHNTKINLRPEFSSHAHAPISDSYGSCESLSAWPPNTKENKEKKENKK